MSPAAIQTRRAARRRVAGLEPPAPPSGPGRRPSDTIGRATPARTAGPAVPGPVSSNGPGRRFQSEHVFQIAAAQFLNRALPTGAFWTSIDSAGRGARDGARMKARGQARGVPDILVLWRKSTVWLELKSARGRMTPEQVDFWGHCSQAGHALFVCRSLREIDTVLISEGIPLRARVAS